MLLMITGLSGAGKSTALHALEDVGFFCTDNLPASMLEAWASHMVQQEYNAAVGIDIRSSENPDLLYQALATIRKDSAWKMIFIDASDKVLMRRFSTLKRRHPHLPDMPLQQAVASERQALLSLKKQADVVFDSSKLTPYQLSDLVESFWKKQALSSPDEQRLVCTLISFSYQRGLPSMADMVLDMRFLPNPHYQVELAPLTGKDQAVQDFLRARADVQQAERHIQDWLSFVWPRLQQERKRYFTIAFGCSGGRHRSVYMTEMIARWMQEQGMGEPIIRHREIGDIQ